MGIRGRIVALSSLAVAAAVIAAAVGSYLAVRSELRGQVDESLGVQAEVAQEIASLGQLGPPEFRSLEAPGTEPLLPGDDVPPQRVNPSGELARSPRSTEALPIEDTDELIAARGSGEVYTDRVVDGHHYRVVTVGVGGEGAMMLARSLDGVDGVLENLRVVLALLVVGGVGLAGGLSLLIARRVVAPITALTEAAEHISQTQDLTRRIPIDGDDEVARLARRFSAMLEALEHHQAALNESVESQQQLVADASHELRTPVSAIRTDIETLLAHPNLAVDQRTQILALADQRIEELSELIVDIIELARGDQSDAGADEDVRLDLVAAESIERLGQLAPGRRVVANLRASVVNGRPDRLFRAINNLLDNADKYSPAEQPIEVTVAAGLVEVRDHGPGIPEADLPQLFDRFWRGSTSRHRAGSGLGLAIVRQVAEAAGGAVEVENLDRGGTAFRLRLPAADSQSDPGQLGDD